MSVAWETNARSNMVCTASDLQEWKDFPRGGSRSFCLTGILLLHPNESKALNLWTTLAEEVVDKAVKEAMSKPWLPLPLSLPLPLGLKPPSTEGVLSELSRQRIPCIPSNINSPDRQWRCNSMSSR
ncbi:hypothetical protein SAY86_023906 [Trapa natans]|uniref:Uncharacterized protein n=1 Tax=Trapa natans TaxID=22666 RepID=A0AAN7RAN9_TRANT|nr:hypothetical protein SAY86_023906 [Trapa natans]